MRGASEGPEYETQKSSSTIAVTAPERGQDNLRSASASALKDQNGTGPKKCIMLARKVYQLRIRNGKSLISWRERRGSNPRPPA
jgi:hypothetical protein